MPLKLRDTLSSHLIDVLATTPHLTVTAIRERLNRSTQRYSSAGVYKELSYLRRVGIIIKQGKAYSLSIPWIISVVDFGERLQERYIKNIYLRSYLPKANTKCIWKFRNLLMLDDFWNELILTLFVESKENYMFEWSPRPWFLLVHREKERALEKAIRFLKKKVYMILGSDGSLEKELANLLDKDTYSISFLKAPFHERQNMYFDVIDDYVLTIKFPRDIYERIRICFNRHSTKAERSRDIVELVTHKSKLSIQIENNPTKAKKLKKQFREYFG